MAETFQLIFIIVLLGECFGQFTVIVVDLHTGQRLSENDGSQSSLNTY